MPILLLPAIATPAFVPENMYLSRSPVDVKVAACTVGKKQSDHVQIIKRSRGIHPTQSGSVKK